MRHDILIPGLTWISVPFASKYDQRKMSAVNSLYDNVAVYDRIRDEQRHLIVCEFCDKQGPTPVLQEPHYSRADDLALRMLSVSFLEDAILISCESTYGEFTISVYGSLRDPVARGFVRSFCVVLFDTKLLYKNGYSSIERAISLVQMKKNILKERNSRYFNLPVTAMISGSKSIQRSKSFDIFARYRRHSNRSLENRKSQSLADIKRPWKFSELTGTNREMVAAAQTNVSHDQIGLSSLCRRYTEFGIRMLNACLIGLPIVVVGVCPRGSIFDIIKYFLREPAFEIASNMVTLSQILCNKLSFVNNKNVRFDPIIYPYCCIYYAIDGQFRGPVYNGRLTQILRVAGGLSDKSCEAYIIANILDLIQWACVISILPMAKRPVGISQDDLKIINYQDVGDKSQNPSYLEIDGDFRIAAPSVNELFT